MERIQITAFLVTLTDLCKFKGLVSHVLQNGIK